MNDDDLDAEGSEFERIDTDGDAIVEIKQSKTAFEKVIQKNKQRSASNTGGNGRVKHSRGAGALKFLDMRHILGFLNQTEWVNALNIGNIMQITPIQRDDLTMHRRNE